MSNCISRARAMSAHAHIHFDTERSSHAVELAMGSVPKLAASGHVSHTEPPPCSVSLYLNS